MAITTITYGPDQTGLTGLYAILRDTTGRPFNTANGAYEAYNAANWTDYDVPLTEQGSTGFYLATVPSAARSALGSSVIYQRAGGSPAVSDTAFGSETFPPAAEAGSTVVQHLLNASAEWPRSEIMLTAGDAAGSVVYQLRDAAGLPIPLADSATVTFTLKKRGADTTAVDGEAATILYAAQGQVSFTFSAETPVPAAGDYDATWNVDGLTLPPNRIYVLIRSGL